tara:strand:+ start:170 stop:433 length:264 start_codon:yes stop_codon:yes gene_type:complete
MGYYKTIEGKRYDGELIELADRLTNNQAGNNPISKADAAELLAAVKDGNSYTDIEKDTIAYIRKNYKWTDASDEWFRGEIRTWAASK